MKILLSAYACSPDDGSEPQNGWNWAKNLANNGHQVWCLTRECNRDSNELFLDKENIKNLKFIYVSLPDSIDKFCHFSIAGIPVGFYVHYFLWQRNAYKFAKKMHYSINFDLVHHVTFGSLLQGSGLWRLDLPLVFGPAGGGQIPPKAFKKYFLEYWNRELIRVWVGIIFSLFNMNVKKTIQHSKLILATNRETYDRAKHLGAKRVELFLDTSLPKAFFPVSVPIREFAQSIKILWVGRVFAFKGLELVMESLSKVDSRVKFSLTIIGDGPVAHLIPAWTKRFNLDGKINHLGYVPWTEISKIYLEHDIFMFCSLRDSSPAQLLEAMAYGLPIVTLDLHGSGFLTPDNAGIKIPAIEPEETVRGLANAIEDLYDNPEKRYLLGKNGYNFAITQTWENKVARAEKYYDEILNSEKILLINN